jgi:hypothetical protein
MGKLATIYLSDEEARTLTRFDSIKRVNQKQKGIVPKNYFFHLSLVLLLFPLVQIHGLFYGERRY